MATETEPASCSVRATHAPHARERGVLLVLLLTLVTMVVEIVAGYATGSMALLSDGWHMGTHVAAFGLASVAYAVSRRFARHRSFVFGTGKVRTLAGYTSALLLGLAAVVMLVESVERLVRPRAVDFGAALPIALVGLLVNVASFFLLHSHDHERGERDHDHDHNHDHHHHDHDHDHNHRAALLHVAADTVTSGLAIVSLLVGRFFDLVWPDPLSGIVGGVLILKWAFELGRHAACELLDMCPSATLEDAICRRLEQLDGVRVRDLHVWSLGGAAKSCVITLTSPEPRDPEVYRAKLAEFRLAHVTIEVQRLRS